MIKHVVNFFRRIGSLFKRNIDKPSTPSVTIKRVKKKKSSKS